MNTSVHIKVVVSIRWIGKTISLRETHQIRNNKNQVIIGCREQLQVTLCFDDAQLIRDDSFK